MQKRKSNLVFSETQLEEESNPKKKIHCSEESNLIIKFHKNINLNELEAKVLFYIHPEKNIFFLS